MCLVWCVPTAIYKISINKPSLVKIANYSYYLEKEQIILQNTVKDNDQLESDKNMERKLVRTWKIYTAHKYTEVNIWGS